jgi:hypothetical protein
MKQAEQLVRQGEQFILGLAWAYRHCWKAACKHDGIDPHTTLACFSSDNSYRPFLDRLFQEYQEALAAYLVWGYVGLRISQR